MKFDAKRIENYWNQYVAGFNDIPDHLDGIDDCILASWKRSKYKANPFEMNPKPLTNEELDELTRKNEKLIHIALPYMIKFYEVAQSATQNVLLTDATGKQLKNISADSKNLMDLMSKISIANGIDYAEDICGTSSVSLSLYEDRPVLLRGAEHYRKIYHGLACFSAPIHALGNKQVGCICITGKLENYQPFIMSALIMMIEAIENELRLSETNAILNKVAQNIRSGFILIDSQLHILLHNEQAQHILKINTDLNNHTLSEFFINDFSNISIKKDLKLTLKKYNGVRIKVFLNIMSISAVNRNDLYLIIFDSLNDLNKEMSLQIGYQAKYHFKDIAGQSEEISKVKELGYLASQSLSNVLIEGENGTGKELLAQAIHNKSSRKNKPFLTVHCSSIPIELMSIELYGDRDSYQMGKLELADGGTLFIDEIDTLSLKCQSLLLDFLQNRYINNKKVDVRIIVATNKDLLHLVKKAQFKEDLYYKLNIINISIPPLRKRRDDIQLLLNLFLNRYRVLLKKDIKGIEKECLSLLMNYNWPGNIRQLESVMEQMVNISKGKYIKFVDLPDNIITESMMQKYETNEIQTIVSPQMIEYREIIKFLKQEHGHMKTVSQILNIPLSTLYRKCIKYNIDPKQYREW